MNDAAINFYAEQGVKGVIYPLENEIPNLKQYRNKNGIVPLFFHPQLFYSRQPVHLKRKFSDADRQYRILTRHGWTIVIPHEPVSVFQFKGKLEEYGYSRFLVDLSFTETDKDELAELLNSYQKGLKWKNGTAFNYKKGLW
jgi:U32 family peptidase